MKQRDNYRDITKRLKVQIAQHIYEDEMLRASEKKYRVLVENLPQKIFYKDKNSVYISCNKNYADDLKIAPEQIVGKTDYDFYSKKLAEKYRTDDKRIMESGTVETIEEIYIQNGTEAIVQTVKAPIKGDEGAVIGVLGIFWDITEHKLAEEALKESEEKYHTLIETANDPIFVADAKTGIIILTNKKAEDMLGIPTDEIIGMHQIQLHPKEEADRFRKIFADHVHKRKAISGDLYICHKNGKKIPVEISASVADMGGKKIIQGIFRDITERKKAEQKIIDYQNQLKLLTSQITLSEEKERHRLSEYLHDQIGQHLFVAKLKLEILQNSLSSNEDTKTVVDVINIIKHIIKSSRSLTVELSPPILYELGFEQALEWLAEQTLKKHDIMVTFDDDKQEKPLDETTKILLYRTVSELLTNVAKHAQTKSAEVSIRKDNSNVRVCVKDDGVGFPYPNEEFSNVKNGGMGLFRIKERLESLNGQIEIETQPNHGTHITLLVPLSSGV